MIDYAKLEQALELVQINKNLDDLITRLQELTQPEPKYKLEQKVWMTVINGYKLDIDSAHILSMTLNKEWEYTIDSAYSDFYIPESELYPSRESLIEAQIEYWKGIKHDQIIPIEEMKPAFDGEVEKFQFSEKCDHDNIVTGAYSRSDPPHKCDICGALYR